MNFKPNMLFLNRSFDKKRLKALLLWFRLNLSENAALKGVEILQGLGFRSATQGAISLGLDDLKTPTSKSGRVFQAQVEVALAHHEHHRGNRTPVELFQHLVDTWHRTSQDLTTEVVQLFHSTERVNPVYMMAFSGARGNISQVRQLVGMRGLMADPRGQIVGFPILSNFREGLTITEYFVSCYGARKGVVDTAIRTADAGYLTRRLADVSHHVVVRTTNCGTHESILLRDIKEGQKTVLSLANRLVGRVLAEHVSLPSSPTQAFGISAQYGRGNSYAPACSDAHLNEPSGQSIKMNPSVQSSAQYPTATRSTPKRVEQEGSGVQLQLPVAKISPFVDTRINREEAVPPTKMDSYPYGGIESILVGGMRQTIIYRNSEITFSLAKKLAAYYSEVPVRSPLSCSLPWGVCQLCYGWGLSEGRRVTLGEAVGIIAAQSIGEPGTQLTLRTFHTGGVFSGELLNEIRAPYNGNVLFPTPLQGLLLRTPHGQIAFLTKVSGKMKIFETEMHFESERENLDTSIPLKDSKNKENFYFSGAKSPQLRNNVVLPRSAELPQRLYLDRVHFSGGYGLAQPLGLTTLRTKFSFASKEGVMTNFHDLLEYLPLRGMQIHLSQTYNSLGVKVAELNQRSPNATLPFNTKQVAKRRIKDLSADLLLGGFSLVELVKRITESKPTDVKITQRWKGIKNKEEFAMAPLKRTPTKMDSYPYQGIESILVGGMGARAWLAGFSGASLLQKHKKPVQNSGLQSAKRLPPQVLHYATQTPYRSILAKGKSFKEEQIGKINFSAASSKGYACGAKQNSEFLIQPSTVIFVKQKEHVVNNQLLAEFSSSTLQSVNDQIEITQQVLSDIAGQIWFKELEYGNRKGPGSGSLGTYFSSQKLGGIWVLAGKQMIDTYPSFASPKSYKWDKSESQHFSGSSATSGPKGFLSGGITKMNSSTRLQNQRNDKSLQIRDLSIKDLSIKDFSPIFHFSGDAKQVAKRRIKDLSAGLLLGGFSLVELPADFRDPTSTKLELVNPFAQKAGACVADFSGATYACTESPEGYQFHKSLKSFIPLLTIVRGKQKLQIENNLSSNVIKEINICFSNNCDRFLIFNNFVLSNLTLSPKRNESLLKRKNLFKYHIYGIQNKLKRSINTRYAKTCTTSIINLQNDYDSLYTSSTKMNPLQMSSEALDQRLVSDLFGVPKMKNQRNYKSLQIRDLSIKDLSKVEPQAEPAKRLTRRNVLCGLTTLQRTTKMKNLRFVTKMQNQRNYKSEIFHFSGDAKQVAKRRIKDLSTDLLPSGVQLQADFNGASTRITSSKTFQGIENKIKKNILVFQELRSLENKSTKMNLIAERKSNTRSSSKKLDMLPLLSESDLVTFVTHYGHNDAVSKNNFALKNSLENAISPLKCTSNIPESCFAQIAPVNANLFQPRRGIFVLPPLTPYFNKTSFSFSTSLSSFNVFNNCATSSLLANSRRNANLFYPISVAGVHYPFSTEMNSHLNVVIKNNSFASSMHSKLNQSYLSTILINKEISLLCIEDVKGKNKRNNFCDMYVARSNLVEKCSSILFPFQVRTDSTNNGRTNPAGPHASLSTTSKTPFANARVNPTDFFVSQGNKSSYFVTEKRRLQSPWIQKKRAYLTYLSQVCSIPLTYQFTKNTKGYTAEAFTNFISHTNLQLSTFHNYVYPPLKWTRSFARVIPFKNFTSESVTSDKDKAKIFHFSGMYKPLIHFVPRKGKVVPIWRKGNGAALHNIISSIKMQNSRNYKSEIFHFSGDAKQVAKRRIKDLSAALLPSACSSIKMNPPYEYPIGVKLRYNKSAICYASVLRFRSFLEQALHPSPLSGYRACSTKMQNRRADAKQIADLLPEEVKLQAGFSGGHGAHLSAGGINNEKLGYLFPGQLVTYGDNITSNIVTTESGQVLYIDSQKTTVRKAQTVLIYSQAIIAVLSGDWIKKGTPLMSLSYQKLVTGDIVQGLPKIEQFFEAPVLRDGTFWSDSLQAKLNQFFQEEREKLPLAEAVRKGFSEIQRVLVEGVLRVYISQGVLIADKHLEVIVRQMTCKGRILYSGDTGFLRNELVSLDKIENVNQVTYGQKALYHPQVRGITDASLESESFLSAASFQETTRVLSRDAIIGKTDLMRGLKERVIVGELIQAGTGLANNSVYNLLADSVA